MKKEPDEIDFEILKNAAALDDKNNGVRLRKVYGSLRGKRAESFLWKRVQVLASEGYLKIETFPGRVMVRLTPKARRLLEHNGPKDGEQ